MNDIDTMDMLGFLHIKTWEANREKKKKEPARRYIDEVWPGLKP